MDPRKQRRTAARHARRRVRNHDRNVAREKAEDLRTTRDADKHRSGRRKAGSGHNPLAAVNGGSSRAVSRHVDPVSVVDARRHYARQRVSDKAEACNGSTDPGIPTSGLTASKATNHRKRQQGGSRLRSRRRYRLAERP